MSYNYIDTWRSYDDDEEVDVCLESRINAVLLAIIILLT